MKRLRQRESLSCDVETLIFGNGISNTLPFSETKMATLNSTKDFKVITCGLKFLLKANDNVTIKEVPKPIAIDKDGQNEASKETKDTEVNKNDSELMKINCSCISSCGKFLALCDDYKQMSVWAVPTLTLIYQQNLVRKASKVIFTPDSKSILVADKNGDG